MYLQQCILLLLRPPTDSDLKECLERDPGLDAARDALAIAERKLSDAGRQRRQRERQERELQEKKQAAAAAKEKLDAEVRQREADAKRRDERERTKREEAAAAATACGGRGCDAGVPGR